MDGHTHTWGPRTQGNTSHKEEGSLTYTTMLMNLKTIVLSDRSQTPKATYYMTPFVRNVQNRQIHSDRRWVSGCQGLGGGDGE